MRERPILFSGPMVRAILEGRKTQTRRAAKPRVRPSLLDGSWADVYVLDEGNREWLMRDCPYGALGDRLWVRETWGEDAHGAVIYRADDQTDRAHAQGWVSQPRWRPSIHMPRARSRLTLAITDVRVERLQDITEADAQAEGCPVTHDGHPYDPPSQDTWQGYGRASFSLLWSKIHGPGAWDANPWVWVVTFEREAPRG